MCKPRFLARFAADVVRSEVPGLRGKLVVRETVLNWHQRAIEQITAAQ